MSDRIIIPGIQGLSARKFIGRSDYEHMARISRLSWQADGFEFLRTKEEFEGIYSEIKLRDPFEDLVFVESGSEVVGYAENYLEPVDALTTSFWTSVHLLPEWRGKGIREALLRHNEERLLHKARDASATGFFQTWSCNEPNDWKDIVMREGFSPSFYVLEMIRGDLDSVQELPLHPGLEVRPVPPERYRDIWNGMKESYRGEPWYVDTLYDEDHFRAWPTKSEFDPELWQVAWDGDRIVGAVQNFISREENEAFNKKVGHTEEIFVLEDWRHKGVASALISRSLRLLARLGMTEATLDVDTENVSGAKRLYSSLGYRPVHEFVFYRKPLPGWEDRAKRAKDFDRGM